ncbi:hypothetical protein [uncultured Tenacibaculum sp.]|uniref:hypothetical protein n=1 Tax=uncultured Tenacibaculum sp. TaxID=174713 RepID=UPI00260BA757|nr:hypothetical protein [uncultured Tenacibaculum sp.]
MKNFFFIFFLLSIYTKCSSQSKTDALLSLGKKIDIHKLIDHKKNYNYLLEEVNFNNKKTIKFIQFCTDGKLCSTAYYLTAKEFSEITIKQTEKSKFIQIFFPNNSIETKKINIKTEEHFSGKTTSSITVFLEKNTPQTEVNKIKKGFVDVLEMYNIENNSGLN